MHVLDWIEGRTGDFVTSINATLAPTGVLVAPSSFWMPISRACPQEARPFRRCPGLLDPAISGAGLNWWLAVPHPLAETPNIDLAVRAKFPDGKDGLVLVEAKAHCAELKQEIKGKRPASRNESSKLNHERIGAAITEASAWLGGDSSGVRISRDTCYQFANRIAMSCFLARHGVPVVLMYLGFKGDAGIGVPFHDLQDWHNQVLAHTKGLVPKSWWNRPITWGGASLWLLIRALPCVRQTPSLP